MNRILDLLILNYQDIANDAYPPVGVYPAFCEALGADRIGRRGFHPFFHEVAEVRQADDPDEPPSIAEERWPGYMMGSMLLTRAGVIVTAGARHLVAGGSPIGQPCTGPSGAGHGPTRTSRTVGGATRSGEPVSAATTWSTADCTTTWTSSWIRLTLGEATRVTSTRPRRSRSSATGAAPSSITVANSSPTTTIMSS
ncbi:hypothetical protein ACFSTC_56460 [Nonomuraea ferruginea]